MDSATYEDSRVRYMRKELFILRLVVTSIFMALALSLYFFGIINFAGVLLILSGALWNFFIDINTMAAFMMSLIVGVIYAMFAIVDGLYINAALYTIFYIPLQFYVFLKNIEVKDLSIKRNKKLGYQKSYLTVVAFVLSFAICFACALINPEQAMPAFDAITACLLGLSAVLLSFNFREYYYVRPIAVMFALELWLFAGLNNGFGSGNIAIMMMYCMYLILDGFALNLWIDLGQARVFQKKPVLSENGLILQDRLEEYRSLPGEDKEEDDGGSVVA